VTELGDDEHRAADTTRPLEVLVAELTAWLKIGT